ncbi:MAG: DPP IV N-terminal domain-containing protein [Hoylesella marshii]|uniref:S9 family peptidase n=1 Tax=Hoylesella marshii TaxID=189722 RepID=UPI003FA0D966
MKTNRVRILLMAFLANIALMTTAQNKLFTLEDLNFGGTNYRNMIPENRYATWWGDELVRQDADKCTLIDKASGKEKTLFTLDALNRWAGTDDQTKVRSLYYTLFPYAGKPLVLVDNGKERMLIDFKSKKRVWRQSSADEQHAEWNAASRAVAFVRNDNLFVTDAAGKTHQLTTDGSREIVYAQSVHRDEFGIYKGTFWSSDGSKLAFYRMDQSMVTDYPLVDIDTRIATAAPTKYPMAGETTHKVSVGIYDMKSGKTVYLQTGDPTDRYFTNISWAPDAKTIYLIEINRDQNVYTLDAYSATDGRKIATLYTEKHEKYVHPLNPITFLPWDSSRFILQTERDGYNHLYLFSLKGNEAKEEKQLTQGAWVVLGLLGFNTKTKSAIILSTERNPIQNNVYAVNVETGKRVLLDNGEGCHLATKGVGGSHAAALSASGAYLYDVYSSPEVPRQINIVATATGKTVEYFAAKDPWIGYQVPQFSSGVLKAADGVTDLYYRMVKPANFDPSKKYPTVIYVYGGPGTRNVEARWHFMSRGWEPYMAQKGYIVFILDNRGSSDRGRAFEQATFRHLGIEEMKDQMKGVEYLKSLPYVDSTRLGVHGWSFGGFMTTNLMTTYPDVFKVGVAGGPVVDWKWYEAMYGERYMDTPQSNPEGYAESSLMPKAKNLKGKLQIITGMNDPVVVPQHCLSFLKACIEAGTQPDFFVYPGEPHNMRGHQSVHLHERITQYFEDYLK